MHSAVAVAVAVAAPSLDRSLSCQPLSRRNPILLVSCLVPSFPSKPTRRKNLLRHKILKTLETSNLPNLTKVPLDSPPLREIEEPGSTKEERQELDELEIATAENEEIKESLQLGEVEVSVPAGNGVDGSPGVFDRNSFVKHGMWLVGTFVFYTVCAVWVVASSGNKNGAAAGSDEFKHRARVALQRNGNGNGKLGVEESAAEPFIHVDDLEMERKIEEIRVMAREAREKERLESNNNGYDSADSEEEMDGERHGKSGIEEEVANRLINLRKKLENTKKKISVASVNYSEKGAVGQDGPGKSLSDEIGSNEALLFPKKYKFKDIVTDSVKKPKGFTGSDGYNISKSRENELFNSGSGHNGAIDLGDGEKLLKSSDVGPKGNNHVDQVVEEGEKKGWSGMDESAKNARGNRMRGRGMSKKEKAKGSSKPKTNGSAMGKNNGKSRKVNAKASESRKSNDMDIAVASTKLSRGNDDLKDEEVGNSELAVESETLTDFWWLSLPYVLAIVMRRRVDNGEAIEGFYTIRSLYSTHDQISHMVTFEDRGDATNFCYLLQSFFEDLEDFQVDVVPVTIQELNEAVKLDILRIMVVKRGQLRLYAGQPLVDAEMALRSLIKQG